MGTNYYWNPDLVRDTLNLDNLNQDDPRVHIGKTSAAGKYCHNCGITQHGDTTYVHHYVSKYREEQLLIDIIRLDDVSCPNCGKPWDTATSFTFTMMGHLKTISNFYNMEVAMCNANPLQKPLEVIMDEYGKKYTAINFLDTIIRKCPIQFQHYGEWS